MITVTTPSVRGDMLEIVDKCLKRQTHRDFEWLVGSPTNLGFGTFVQEPPKREGDYYGLNKAWNALFKQAKGELIVNIVDGLWFEPTLLERLWLHYQNNPKALVSCVGNQYDQVLNGKPEHQVWVDPRRRSDIGSFYEINPIDLELCIASLPRQAIFDVGGVDEEYDKYAAISEKEMALRMDKMGYRFYIDQSLEYRAVKHPRLNSEWDKHYEEGGKLFTKHVAQIDAGTRRTLDYLRNGA